MSEQDIFSFADEGSERVIERYSDTSSDIERAGMRDFFIPAACGGVFLCLCALLGWGLFSFSGVSSGATAALGLALLSASSIFLAIFRRRARAARGTSLCITSRALVYRRGTALIRLELCDICSIALEDESERERAPFDMLSCEGARIMVVMLDGTEYALPYVRDARAAVLRACSLLDNRALM